MGIWILSVNTAMWHLEHLLSTWGEGLVLVCFSIFDTEFHYLELAEIQLPLPSEGGD